MRKLLLLVALLLAPLPAAAQIATGCIGAGCADTAPTANDIVLDTGALPVGRISWFLVHCSCSVAPAATATNCAVIIEHRDAANAANVADGLVGEHGITLPIAQGLDSDTCTAPVTCPSVIDSDFWPKFPDVNWGLTIALNERLRVRNLTTFTGQIFCDLIYR